MQNDGPPRPSSDQHSKSLDAEVRELTFQLEDLVRELESEFRETGTVSSIKAAALHHLRLRFQQLLSRGS